jgi:DNA mismatch endonuclease (patch repair protein)
MPERTVRSLLHRLGYRFRIHRGDLPGNPDIVLPRYRTIIFIHGCYWHRHKGCKFAYTPKSNVEFWQHKFDENVKRDEMVIRQLRGQGWRVLVVWECQVGNERVLVKRLNRFLEKEIRQVDATLRNRVNSSGSILRTSSDFNV